jgi:hypothetical protein
MLIPIRKTVNGIEYWDSEEKRIIFQTEKPKVTKTTKAKSKSNESK